MRMRRRDVFKSQGEAPELVMLRCYPHDALYVNCEY